MLNFKDSKITLFFGLNHYFFVSTGSKKFSVDLTYNKILLNIYPFDCLSNIDCEISSKEILTNKYKKQTYIYQNAKTFLSWDKISPAVIENIDQYNYLRVFDVQNIITKPLNLIGKIKKNANFKML